MNNKKSIIVEADEATQDIMREIGDSFDDSLNEGFSSLKNDVTDEIINRLKNFDVFKMTPEQLRKLKDDTQKLINSVSPIELSVKAQQTAIAKTQSAISNIETKIDDAKWADIRNQMDTIKKELGTQYEQIASLANNMEKIQETLGIIVNLVTPFWKKWKKNNKEEQQ